MIANRALGMDDYLTMFRRHRLVVLVSALGATLAGFLISFALSPKYTSRSLLFVQAQMVPTGYVKPITTQTTGDRMVFLQQQVLKRSSLEPLVAGLELTSHGKSVADVVEDIRNNISIQAADPRSPPPPDTASTSAPGAKNKRPEDKNPNGFTVSYTAEQPRDAQEICSEITSALLREDSRLSQQLTQGTADLLSEQLDRAKQNLHDLDKKVAAFKKHHLGQLPTDADNNLRILAELNARLDAVTQTLARAQQDKLFAESLLSQQEGAWKLMQVSPELPALQQQLVTLQDKLITLEVRYTPNYPEITKTKNDITEVKNQIKQLNSGSGQNPAENSAARGEPAEILQLRQQIHSSEDTVNAATTEQKRLTAQIDTYEGRLALSPDVEEEYKRLTRDSDSAQRLYDDLLAKNSEAEMQTEMERRQEGQQMALLYPASLPTSPSFPVRWKFAAGALAAGLVIGLGIAAFLEMKDQSLRNEGDVLAGLDEQMIGSVPWVAEEAYSQGRLRGAWNRLFVVRKKPA